MNAGASIAIFIPAYQVEHSLARVVARIPEALWPDVSACWIINDGSRDGTAAAAERLAQERPDKVRAVHLDPNRGYGGVVKEGLARCREIGADFSFCVHGDGQYPPEAIPDFVAALRREQIDILQGSRHAGGTALQGGMPVYKWAAGKALVFLENAAFGLRMTDYHSGFLAYSKRALQVLPFQRLSPSFDIDLELIASARALGLRVSELPIPTHYGDEESHLSPIPYGLRVLRVILRYRMGAYHRLARAAS